MRLVSLFLSCVLLWTGIAVADRDTHVNVARQGWNYQLRTTMIGRDLAIPVHIHGRDLAGASICVVGDPPHALTRETLTAFRALLHHTFGKPVGLRYAGPSTRFCGSGRTVILRLYSGFPPNRALSDDLRWLNRAYGLGLPRQREYAAASPAMAQTFFGHFGMGTHIMVKQPARPDPTELARAFYRSILVEELFQVFTFGMDILHLDRSGFFVSKLQERPVDLRRLSWESPDFMRGLLKSNPGGLCAFDIMMLHAVATSPVDQTTEPEFIDYIDEAYERLQAMARETMADPRFAPVVDPNCRAPA